MVMMIMTLILILITEITKQTINTKVYIERHSPITKQRAFVENFLDP